MLSVGLILAAQAALQGDDSIATLGVNLINMGVVAVGPAHAVFHVMQGERKMLKDTAQLLAIASASYISTLTAALSIGLIIGYNLGSLMAFYFIVGLFEALVSVSIFTPKYQLIIS